MIIKTPYVEPERQTYREHVRCDICGADQVRQEWPEKNTKYHRSAEHEVTVEHVTRYDGYESDGAKKGQAWDFCPGCFEEKVKPLLLTLAQPREIDESW